MNDDQYKIFGEDTGFLNQLVGGLSDAVFVVNSDIKVVYHNKIFATLFGESGEQLLGKRFGASIGCKGHEKKYPEAICSHCKLRSTMLATITNASDQEKRTVVLEMATGNREELRLIQFKSNFMEYQDKKYAVVVLNDLTHIGNETLEFINKFYEAGE